MPPKQSEDKAILEQIGYWAKIFFTSLIGALITYSLSRQVREEEKRNTQMENQNKFNGDVSRALDKLEGTQEYLRRDLDRNEKADEKRDEDFERHKENHQR